MELILVSVLVHISTPIKPYNLAYRATVKSIAIAMYNFIMHAINALDNTIRGMHGIVGWP